MGHETISYTNETKNYLDNAILMTQPHAMLIFFFSFYFYATFI